jgi:hypothetical protein
MNDKTLLALLNELTRLVNGAKHEFSEGERPLHFICFDIQANGIKKETASEAMKQLSAIKAAVDLMERNIKLKLTLNGKANN